MATVRVKMLPDQPSPSADGPAESFRELGVGDLPALIELLDRDRDAHCVVAERVVAAQLDPMGSGGPTWGWFSAGALRSALFIGPNVILIETTPAARVEFASKLAQVGRRSSAIVGYREEVLDLWQRLAPTWGPCRELRDDQPLMVCIQDPEAESLEGVRRLGIEDLDVFMPAAIDMFTEEVGVSPVAGGRGPGYRARVAQSISQGRVYGRIDRGEVIFKAEIGAVGRGSAQLQGVWITPRLRGSGLSTSALSAVVKVARAEHAPRISLYANHHNEPALRAYERVGFRQIGTFATVLF